MLAITLLIDWVSIFLSKHRWALDCIVKTNSKHSIVLARYAFNDTCKVVFFICNSCDSNTCMSFTRYLYISLIEVRKLIHRYCVRTQVSSIHNIEHHCSRVQSTCSWAQSSRVNRLISKMSDFLRASLRNMSSFWKVLRIVVFDTWKFNRNVISIYDIRLIFFEDYI